MCDECGTDISLKKKREYIRIIVFCNHDAYEREFCSIRCLQDYIRGWDESTTFGVYV